MVVLIVAWVTAGSITPGVQAGSGRTSRMWQEADTVSLTIGLAVVGVAADGEPTVGWDVTYACRDREPMIIALTRTIEVRERFRGI